MLSGAEFIVKGSAVYIKYYTYLVMFESESWTSISWLTDFLVVVVGWLSMAQLLWETVTTLFQNTLYIKYILFQINKYSSEILKRSTCGWVNQCNCHVVECNCHQMTVSLEHKIGVEQAGQAFYILLGAEFSGSQQAWVTLSC